MELRWPQVAGAVMQGFPLGAEDFAAGASKGLEGPGAGEHDKFVAEAAARYMIPLYAGLVQDRPRRPKGGGAG
jgi:hypothetical protein